VRKVRLRPLGLKDFQQATVDYAFRRLFDDDDRVSRFLIADEVGLGKTLCARGLIARTIERLQQEGVRRIDVIYVCSNVDIARQNVARLNPTYQDDFHLAGRITLLPLHLRQLSRNPVNLVSFTPGTSLDLKSSTGKVEERAVLYWLLRRAWGARAVGGVGAKRLLAVDAAVSSLEWWIGATHGKLDRDLANAFAERLEREAESDAADLKARFDELKRRLGARHSGPRQEDRDDRRQLIGELRNLLAEVCIDALEPDLVILDEFQRFKHLLDPHNPAGELAQQLFQYQEARIILLSATPYKMYTVTEDVSDDHYADFIKTLEFLIGPEEAGRFRDDLRAYREALLSSDGSDFGPARARKATVEQTLRRVMARTERLASTPDRSGMLVERACSGVRLEAADLRSYVALDRLSQRLGAGDVLEYWKSTPYLLNFMEDYKLAKAVDDREDHRLTRPQLSRLLRDLRSISWDAFEDFRMLEAANPRMRSLWEDTIESGAWRLLWIPPSLPYYASGPPYDEPKLGEFTKRLVFSAWTVVPKAIASMLSYEAERRAIAGRGRRRRNTPADREKIRPLLRFARSKGRLAGMPALAVLYPSPALAEIADPRMLAADVGGREAPAARAAVVALARKRVAAALAPVLEAADRSRPPDDRWYWAAPFLLDQLHDAGKHDEWLSRWNVAGAWVGEGGEAVERSSLVEHVIEAHQLSLGEGGGPPLGAPPEGLIDVVTDLALAGPGVCALRAMAGIAKRRRALWSTEVRDAAARIAWGLRSLFNTPEAMALVRQRGRGPYWQRVLGHSLAGNLQAVLDEYAHVLVEWLGLSDREPEEVVAGVAQAMYDALSLRRVGYVARDVATRERDGRFARRRMPGRFALRFSDERGDDGQAVNRRASVHRAFNSPFWPFVLATTSVGQEGLDFHLYSHAVVHWNLPANPVDLEQREGRVHRYKGHAIRKNVARTCRSAAFGRNDPWQSLFETADAYRTKGQTEIVPSWVFPTPDGARIERYVPALPLSREKAKLADLRRGLAIYRLAFGQPRQADLVEYLRSRFSEEEIERLLNEFRIDVSPPAIAAAALSD
jgi:Helicase conserved C-terminal domain